MGIMDEIRNGILLKNYLIGYVVNYKTNRGAIEGQKILSHSIKTFSCNIEKIREVQKELLIFHEDQISGKALEIVNIEIISVSKIDD